MPVIGYLNASSPHINPHYPPAFRQGLALLGRPRDRRRRRVRGNGGGRCHARAGEECDRRDDDRSETGAEDRTEECPALSLSGTHS